MGKRQERENEIANELIREEERKIGRSLTNEEIVEKFQKAEKIVEQEMIEQRREHKREHKINKIKRKIVAILATLGITIGGATALLNSGEKTEPERPSGQETDIDNGKDNETPKTDREKFLVELQEGVDISINGTKESQNEINEQLNDTIDAILEEYNGNLPEEEKINKDDLGIILRNNVGEGHIREVTSEDGKIAYVENPLVSGDLPEGQEWVDEKNISNEYILVDTENNSTVAGMGTIDNTKTEIDVQYASFGGQEYVKNDETYVGLPEGVDLEEAYEDFSEYYQFRVQEKQQESESQVQDNGFDR